MQSRFALQGNRDSDFDYSRLPSFAEDSHRDSSPEHEADREQEEPRSRWGWGQQRQGSHLSQRGEFLALTLDSESKSCTDSVELERERAA